MHGICCTPSSGRARSDGDGSLNKRGVTRRRCGRRCARPTRSPAARDNHQVNPLRRALIGLAVAGVVMGVLMAVVIAISDHADDPAVQAVLSLIVAWSFLGTGIVVWDRRPGNLMGP